MTGSLQERFRRLLERHVRKLTLRGHKATGLAPCHEDYSPSFAADLEKLVWYCHACGIGGGVRDFALRVGEPWNSTASDVRGVRARRARFQAERQAQAILERRAEERDIALCMQHREAHGEALAAADLLGLFHRRPDLAKEFPDLVARAEQKYGELLFRLSTLEARLNGELA